MRTEAGGLSGRVVEWAVRRRRRVLYLVMLLIAAGIWALQTLRVDAFPDLTDVQVQILVEAPGLSPVEVERLTITPIELALNGMPRVVQVRSLSKYGFGVITVVFQDGVDLYFARTLVSERLQQANLGPLAGAISEVYQYVLEGPGLDPMQLRTLHDRVVRPQLRTVPGIAEVNSFGGIVQQAQITISPERLVAFGLTLHDVVEAIRASNAIAPGGYLEHGDEQYILRGLGQAASLDDLRNTVIRTAHAGVPVRIGDVATVAFGPELRQGAVTRDGRGEVVSGFVMMLRGENSRDVVKRVRQRVAQINRTLPQGVRVVPYYDQMNLVQGTLRTVRTNLIEGGLLVIAVLLFFLGDVRASLIVASTIPLSLLCAFIGMRSLGLSANLMSLGAIDFGMIVDGAVVMVEQFARRVRAEAGTTDIRSQIAAAAREVGRPIVFGVSIIMIVYLPIVTLQGMEARMFRPMALTVACALFGSLLLTILFVPAVSTWVFARNVSHSARAERLEQWLESKYAPVLRQLLSAPRRVFAVAAVVLIGSLALLPLLGTEFLPELDEGSLLVQATRDPSVSLSRSIAMQQELERTVARSPEVTTVVGRIGRPEIASDPMGLHQTDMFVMLKPRSEWRSNVSKDELIEEMRERIEDRIPGMAIRFTQPMAMRLDELVSGVQADLAVKVFGDDPVQIRTVAGSVARVIRGVEGAEEVQVEATQGQAYLNVMMDRTAMARFGIPMSAVQEAIETAVGGRPVSEMLDGNYRIDVVVQYPPSLRTSPEAIGAITIPSPLGARVPLSQIADIRLESGPVQVSRERAQRLVIVMANVTGRDLGSFVADVQDAVAQRVAVPTGSWLAYGGEFENQQRAARRLRLVLPLAILLIGFLLFASLRSWWLAGLVLVNLPFAAVGGILALALRGLHLSVSASIGFIALFGVAVLNGLVLLSTIQQLHAAGAAAADAALSGARQRLRPVLMTAAVASLGFMPVAVSHGVGAEVQRPLATVVIGGLATSTLLTLFVLPTAYAAIQAWRERRRQ
jgi:cobalt-zinc-cadmium resistance protein CzcA